MKEKYQSKYLSKEESAKKKFPFGLLIVLFVLIVALVGAIFLMKNRDIPQGDKLQDEQQAQTQATVEQQTNTEVRYAALETKIGTLEVNEAYIDSLRHEEIIQDGVITEVFYMLIEGGEYEIFRICFGDSKQGNMIGTLQTEEQLIPVSVVICDVSENLIDNDETRANYYALMDQLDTLLESIRQREDFIPQGSQTESRKEIVQLTFWELELPEAVSCKEDMSNESYRVDFYGEIQGEKAHLYTISFEEDEKANLLGVFEVNGEQHSIYITTYTMKDQTFEIDDQYAAEYAALMESIENVIQVITSDKKHSDGIG